MIVLTVTFVLSGKIPSVSCPVAAAAAGHRSFSPPPEIDLLGEVAVGVDPASNTGRVDHSSSR